MLVCGEGTMEPDVHCDPCVVQARGMRFLPSLHAGWSRAAPHGKLRKSGREGLESQGINPDVMARLKGVPDNQSQVPPRFGSHLCFPIRVTSAGFSWAPLLF